MKCSKIIVLLGPYLDGECSPKELRKVKEHLRGCPACRSELELLRRIEIGSRRAGPPDPGGEYWNTFLPRLRQRIGQEQRQPAPGGLGERIRRLFAPPVPWIRLAGAVATAVLVVVIGRAFIGQKGDLVPMRSPAGRPPTDQVRPAEQDIEGAPLAADSVPASGEKATPTSPDREAVERQEIGTAAQEKAPAVTENVTVPVETAEAKKRAATGPAGEISETVAEISPATEVPAVRDETPEPETDRLMTEDRATAGLQAPAITEETAERSAGPEIRAMARSTAGYDHRKQIQHWAAVVDSTSDRSVLATARLALAESWYQLAMAEPDQETLTAALRAHRAALECPRRFRPGAS